MLPELRKYLGAIPNLGALMDQVVLESGLNINNFEDLKGTRETAREQVLANLRETRGLHTLVMYPDLLETCATCNTPIKGGYMELNNTATGKSMLIPMFVWHQCVEHGVLNYVETVSNLGGSRVSERPMPVDLRAVLQVMHPAIPPEVVAGLQLFQQTQAAARNA